MSGERCKKRLSVINDAYLQSEYVYIQVLDMLYVCSVLIDTEFEEKALLTYRIMGTLVDQ